MTTPPQLRNSRGWARRPATVHVRAAPCPSVGRDSPLSWTRSVSAAAGRKSALGTRLAHVLAAGTRHSAAVWVSAWRCAYCNWSRTEKAGATGSCAVHSQHAHSICKLAECTGAKSGPVSHPRVVHGTAQRCVLVVVCLSVQQPPGSCCCDAAHLVLCAPETCCRMLPKRGPLLPP